MNGLPLFPAVSGLFALAATLLQPGVWLVPVLAIAGGLLAMQAVRRANPV